MGIPAALTLADTAVGQYPDSPVGSHMTGAAMCFRKPQDPRARGPPYCTRVKDLRTLNKLFINRWKREKR